MALRWLERLELRLYRDAAAVACLTRSFVTIARRARHRRGQAPLRAERHRPGVLVERRPRRALAASWAWRADEVLVSYVGTIGHGARPATVLDAAPSFATRAPDVRLLIVGDGAELRGAARRRPRRAA